MLVSVRNAKILASFSTSSDKENPVDTASKSEPIKHDISVIPTAILRSFIEKGNLRQLVNGIEDSVRTSSETTITENAIQTGNFSSRLKYFPLLNFIFVYLIQQKLWIDAVQQSIHLIAM